MLIKALIRFRYELAIEAFFTAARFIASNQNHCAALWIERESEAPCTVRGIKAKFLHIGVL